MPLMNKPETDHSNIDCKQTNKLIDSSINLTNILINRLHKFGYSRADITAATKHIKDKNNINDIIKYATQNSKSNPNLCISKTNPNNFINSTNPINITIDSLINSLPTHGKIEHHSSTSYWCVTLPEKWQNQSVNIAELSYLFIKQHNNEYNKSVSMGKLWANMVNTNDNKNINPNIQCVAPPSVAGLHISLGSYKNVTNKDKPKNLIEGVNVSFKIKNIRVFPSIRKTPQNIEGQSTKNGLRYYPTLWVLAFVDFIDFQFKTLYPSHISLACIAVELNVDQVAKFEQNIPKSK